LLLTPAEAARALGIGRTKLFELIGRGDLESVLIDTARRIPSEALTQFVDQLRRGNDEPRRQRRNRKPPLKITRSEADEDGEAS
jgi:excisionase family DNA binding protein